MNYWLAQFLSALGGQALAARNSDEKNTGWMQILVFVILAVFYAVGSIVKAKANKTAPKAKEQTSRKPPVREHPELQMLKQLFGLSEEAESSSQPSPEASKPLVRAEPAVARQSAKPKVQPTSRRVARHQPAVRKTPIEVSKMATKIEKVPELAVAMPQVQPKLGKVTAGVAAPAEIPQEKYLSGILSDYEDPEKLRRAILHYEILGKPVSLREQERAF
jgi:hypothetical protein